MFLKQPLLIALLLLSATFSFSQKIQETAPGRYFIRFTDKNNTPYSIERPEEFLSERAIQRRINQNIPIAENDLPIDPAYIDNLISLGIKIINQSKWFNGVTIECNDKEMLETISNLSFIEGDNLQAKNILKELKVENSPKFIESTASSNVRENIFDYGESLSQIRMLNGNILQNQGFQGEGIIIAITDAGFTNVDILPAFDSLYANNQILGYKDFVKDTLDIFNASDHGMNVMSVIGGNIPGHLIGTAPKAKFWLLRSENVTSEYLIEEDNWISAAEFADSAGVDIINVSLGYSLYNDSTQNHTYQDMDGNTTRISRAADIAASKGILVVSSAGNEGNNSWRYITAPADADSVLTVGAVDMLENYVSFSSQGPSYDGRVKPNIVAQGHRTALESASGIIYYGNGTSFSAPVISGLAACLWQANPELTNMEIIKAIEESADQYSNPDNLKGYGVPDFALANFRVKGINYSDFYHENLVNIYPNPFSDHINIEFYSIDSQFVNIEIFDIMGKKVFSKEVFLNFTSYNNIKVNDLGFLPKGVYFLRLSTNETSYISKLIKQ